MGSCLSGLINNTSFIRVIPREASCSQLRTIVFVVPILIARGKRVIPFIFVEYPYNLGLVSERTEIRGCALRTVACCNFFAVSLTVRVIYI